MSIHSRAGRSALPAPSSATTVQQVVSAREQVGAGGSGCACGQKSVLVPCHALHILSMLSGSCALTVVGRQQQPAPLTHADGCHLSGLDASRGNRLAHGGAQASPPAQGHGRQVWGAGTPSSCHTPAGHSNQKIVGTGCRHTARQPTSRRGPAPPIRGVGRRWGRAG